jgi:hypothetical protein
MCSAAERDGRTADRQLHAYELDARQEYATTRELAVSKYKRSGACCAGGAGCADLVAHQARPVSLFAGSTPPRALDSCPHTHAQTRVRCQTQRSCARGARCARPSPTCAACWRAWGRWRAARLAAPACRSCSSRRASSGIATAACARR